MSLGWYYTFTYYGRSGWPMPIPDVTTALILYYFSVINADTVVQAVHWMFVFPIAGFIWSGSLILLARLARQPIVSWANLSASFALASIPLILPLPWMAYIAGHTTDGFSFNRMIAVALRHGFVNPAVWLTPLYFGLGLVALMLQLRACRGAFVCRGTRAWLHIIAGIITATALACSIGALSAFPLRAFFE